MRRILSLNSLKLWIFYYLLLLLLFFFAMRPNAEYSIIIRLLFLASTFLPAFFKLEVLPFVFLCFYGISSTSFCVILPTQSFYYLIIIGIGYLLYKHKSIFCAKSLLVWGYFLFFSLLKLDFNDIFTWLFIAILLGDMIKDKKDMQMLLYAFIFISLFLSLLFIVHREEFLTQYGSHTLELEHAGWVNPNTFGAIIAAGGILSMSYVTNFLKFKKNVFLSIVCIITVILSFFVIVLNSSRGALFAFIIPAFVMVLFSNLKLSIKILFIIFSSILIVLMLDGGTFDLLFYRLQDETFSTGGSRAIIWEAKMQYFFREANLLELFFGIGLPETLKIGTTKMFSTHNDFVTSLIAFGVIGFCLFVYFVTYPIIKANKKNKFFICMLSLYLLVEMCVLEPFFRAKIVVIMFYIFVLKYSLLNLNTDTIK